MHEQACISRSARGAVWGVLTCLFVLSCYKGPKIFFACGAPRIPLEISKETVFSLQCFSFGPGAVLGGAYMLVRGHACSCTGVLLLLIPSPKLLSLPHLPFSSSQDGSSASSFWALLVDELVGVCPHAQFLEIHSHHPTLGCCKHPNEKKPSTSN